MSTSEERVILEFCAGWAEGDAGALAAFFTEDATYRNIPAPAPVEGREAILRFIEGAFAQLQIEFVVHEIASKGPVVFTERTDVIVTRDGDRIDLPVAGVAEVRDGRITSWRDYYDPDGGAASSSAVMSARVDEPPHDATSRRDGPSSRDWR